MNLLASYLNTKSITKNNVLLMALVFSFMLILPSCSIPQLNTAEAPAPLPDKFNGSVSAQSSATVPWRGFFTDPTLVSLIDQSLVGNQELKILSQEVAIANYGVLSRRGAYLPFVTFGSRAGIEKSSRFTREGAVEDQLTVAPGTPFPEPLPDFLIAANLSWEIDIWRKLRNARDAQALRYLATQEGQNYIVTRLVAEVAEKYYELMALDNRMSTLDATIRIQEQSLEVAKANKAAARGTELAVQRFQAEVQKNQSQKLIIRQEIVEVENRINFLAGRFPQRVERMSADYLQLKLPELSLGSPAQLLQNRPDVRQAERELEAAGLDVQVARANFYPSLNILSGVGVRGAKGEYVFMTPESLIYNAAGEVTAPLLNKAAIKAEYLSANAFQLEKIYDYQRTVLNAYIEVINRISKVENYRQSIEVKKQQLASLEASVDSATKLFQNARTEYADVLFSQRDLNEAKLVLIETKQQQLAAVINTYQALGGGGVMPGFGVVPEMEAPASPFRRFINYFCF